MKASPYYSSDDPALRRLARIALLAGAFAWPAAFVHGQAAPAEPTADDEETPIVLSPFVVDSTQDRGYAATSTLAGTRIRTDLADIGSSISVITREMLTDLGATNNESVLAYAVNTEIGGARGNFSGNIGVSGERYQEEGTFSNPNGNTRVRGLTSADNTRNFFLTDIPWDSYNTSRVDLQRGPNAILFGLGSPAGVVNATTTSAEFRDRGRFEIAFDKFSSQRYVLDVNQQIIPQQLALRVALLRDDKKFRQDPAFQLDQRAYAAITFRPEQLNRNGNTFEVTANYEHGDISSNRPRVVAPIDRLTGYWDPLERGGVGKQVFDPYTTDININTHANLGGAG
ncbi:MAG TPA: TonB-dependent receptor plug domain-containing protein, partial [Opitutus sp.]|nr:TonB-dependent receptor plug domain-containing protein [Opitutus sp.]